MSWLVTAIPTATKRCPNLEAGVVNVPVSVRAVWGYNLTFLLRNKCRRDWPWLKLPIASIVSGYSQKRTPFTSVQSVLHSGSSGIKLYRDNFRKNSEWQYTIVSLTNHIPHAILDYHFFLSQKSGTSPWTEQLSHRHHWFLECRTHDLNNGVQWFAC